MEGNRVTSLLVISRHTNINFLQFSHFLNNVHYLWARGGVLQPTQLDEIPQFIQHRSSIRWSFWPLTRQDSSTCTMIVIVRKNRGACVYLMQSIVQGQPFLSVRKRLLKGYLEGNAGEGKYVTFCRPLELSASVKEFRSHPFWGAHSDSRIRHRHVSKVGKSEVSNFCFPVAVNKYVRLDNHNRQSSRK
jgi:hypothetical protein